MGYCQKHDFERDDPERNGVYRSRSYIILNYTPSIAKSFKNSRETLQNDSPIFIGKDAPNGSFSMLHKQKFV